MVTMRIQGQAMPRTIARLRYVCIHCLSPIKNKNFGLICLANDQHYGFIRKDEAAKLTQEERFMKIGDMFPSDYLRGIDVAQPFIATIKAVEAEQVKRNETQKMELEYVMYFEETPKKLRLNMTMAKECALIVNDPDTDGWIGKKVTVYRETIKAFGKDYIVPRIRQVQKGDKPLNAPKHITELTKKEFFGKVKAELGVPPDIAGQTLLSAGLVNGDGYQPDRAEEYWTEIKLTGNAYLEWLGIQESSPGPLTREMILDWMKGKRFTIDGQETLANELANYAQTVADEEAANGS